MGPVRQNPIQRTVSLFICVCIALCTIVAHNIAQNRPDSFPPYSPDNHHCSDDVYLREGGSSNEANMQNLLKFAGVPQTDKLISATNGPKFTILRRREDVWRYCWLTTFFWLSIHALVAKTQSDKLVWWCPDGEFLAIFCVLYFQRGA